MEIDPEYSTTLRRGKGLGLRSGNSRNMSSPEKNYKVQTTNNKFSDLPITEAPETERY